MQNIVILAGNIGQKPEVRSTQSGTKITNFTLATSRPRLSEGRVMRDENGYRVMDTEWHRITCFNGLGKTVAEHCEKGMKVLVHGRIHYTKWTDATGTDRYGCEIIAEKIDFLSRPKSAENENPELVDRDATVTELTAPFPMSMPAVSRHLKTLERAGLISRTRSGKLRMSRLEPAPLHEAADWIERFRQFWDTSLTRLDAHLAAVQAAERTTRSKEH